MKLDLEGIVRAVIVSLLLALVTGAFKTYMAVHDLQRDVQSMRAELNDLWVQANDQIQDTKKGAGAPAPTPTAGKTVVVVRAKPLPVSNQ